MVSGLWFRSVCVCVCVCEGGSDGDDDDGGGCVLTVVWRCRWRLRGGGILGKDGGGLGQGR